MSGADSRRRDPPGEAHLRKTSTRRRTQAQSIADRRVGPDGSTALEESEIIDCNTRFVSFRIAHGGAYALHVEETTLLGGGRGTAQVTVSVDDRRVISRLLGF